MHAKDLSIDDRPQRKVVKHVAAVPPNVGAPVLALTLVVEAVNLRDLARLVVAPDEGDPVGVADFEQQEQEEGFD